MAATSIFYTAKSVRRQPTFSPLDKSRRTFLGAFLTLVVLTSACAVFYIGTHVQAVNLGYKLSQELQKKEQLIEENKRLDLEIARLKSPTRIEEEAKAAFGLVLPKTQQVYYLSRWDEELTTRLAATPEKTPDKVAAKVPSKDPAKAPSPAAPKAIAKAPDGPTPVKPKADEPKIAKVAPAVKCGSPPCHSEDPKGPRNLIPAKAVPDPSLALRMTPQLKAPPSKKPASLAAEKPQPKIAAKTVSPQATKVAAPAPAAEDPRKSDVEDSPAKVAPSKALAQNVPAAKPSKPQAPAPATAKNDPAKPAKAPAIKPSAETKLAKKVVLLVAEKSAKPKAGPALAYQPKEKVPAVMLDPMP